MYKMLLTGLSISAVLATLAFTATADVGQNAARKALRAGEIRPLTELLMQVERTCAGDLIEIELDQEDGVWTYEIKLLGPQGDVNELEYNARSFVLLEAEGHSLDALGCVPEGTPD